MAITLSDGVTTVELSDALVWTDELVADRVRGSVGYSLSGALLVQVQGLAGGRPITLGPDGESRAWMPRSVLLQCAAWANTPGQQLTLVLRGQARTVMWRVHEQPCIDAKPVVAYVDGDITPTDDYTATLKLMEL